MLWTENRKPQPPLLTKSQFPWFERIQPFHYHGDVREVKPRYLDAQWADVPTYCGTLWLARHAKRACRRMGSAVKNPMTLDGWRVIRGWIDFAGIRKLGTPGGVYVMCPWWGLWLWELGEAWWWGSDGVVGKAPTWQFPMKLFQSSIEESGGNLPCVPSPV